MRYGTETLNVCVIMCWHLAVMKYRLETEVALVQVNVIHNIFNGLTTIFRPPDISFL